MAPGGPAKKGGKKSSSKPKLDANGRPAKLKKVKEVVYDPDQRKEYLTGFSKRKKAKQTAKRNRAIEREKDELRKMRQQIRDQRKEQAAHNVKMAKMAYGDAGGTSDEEDGDEDGSGASGSDASSDEEDADAPEAEYETADALTTVSVAPLSLSRSPSPDPSYSAPAPTASAFSSAPAQQTSAYKKRVRSTVQARPKLTKKDRKDIVTGGKKVKKQLLNRMKGTKARSAR
ncbi:hypothetical protein JCM8097_000397 [Rhodosporidiobolus ruineniae]